MGEPLMSYLDKLPFATQMANLHLRVDNNLCTPWVVNHGRFLKLKKNGNFYGESCQNMCHFEAKGPYFDIVQAKKSDFLLEED